MANKLKEYREEKGLMQEDLAEKAQVPVELVRAIEDGRVGDSDAVATASEEKEDLSDKLDNIKGVCMVSAEELDALMNTLFQARIGLERSHYDFAEFKMILTVETALESIIRNLEAACD